MWIVLVSFPAHWQNVWENLPKEGQAYSAHAFRGFSPWAFRTAWGPVMRGSIMGESLLEQNGLLSWAWDEGWGQGYFPNGVPTSEPSCECGNESIDKVSALVMPLTSRLWALVRVLWSHPSPEHWCRRSIFCMWAFDTLQVWTLTHIKVGSSSQSVLVII